MIDLRNFFPGLLRVAYSHSAIVLPASAQQPQKLNILVIMGDDIGWMQQSTYHQGLMVGETPTSTLVPTGG